MAVVKATATLTDINGNPLSGKTIKFYYSDDGETWNLLGTAVTDENGRAGIVDWIEHTTYYKAVFEGDDIYEPSEATAEFRFGLVIFSLVNLTPTSINVKIGSEFTVSVTIRNDGSESGTCKVQLIDHEGTVQDEKSDTIAPGEEKTFTLTGTAPTYVTEVTYVVKWVPA